MSHRKFEAPRHGSKGFLPKKRYYDGLPFASKYFSLSHLIYSSFYPNLLPFWSGPSATVASPSPSPRTIPARRFIWPASWDTRYRILSGTLLKWWTKDPTLNLCWKSWAFHWKSIKTMGRFNWISVWLLINLIVGWYVPHRARDGPSRLQEQQEGGEIATCADFHSVIWW